MRCEKREVKDADTDCSAYGTSVMVSASGRRCVTNAEHTTHPTVSCPTGGGWTLTGGQCQKTIQVDEVRTTVDEVQYEVEYTVRVAPYTAQVRKAPYTETVRVAPYTAQVRKAPYTETVRVAPFTETVTQTYTRRQRYCAQYDHEFGTGCIRWAYRNVTETVTETVDAYNYETRDVYNYETVDAYNYETRDVYNYETVDAYNYETRTRWECCKSVVREVTVTVDRTVKLDPKRMKRTCPTTYVLDTNTNHCKRPAGTYLGNGSSVCPDSTWTLDSTDRTCSRVLPGVVRYTCDEGDTEITPETTPPTCSTYVCPADYQLDSTASPTECFRYVCPDGYSLDSTSPTAMCFQYKCSEGYRLDSPDSTPKCTYLECSDGQHRFDGEPVSSCHDNHEVPTRCSGTYTKHSATNTHQDVPCPTDIDCPVSSGYLARQMHRHTDTKGHANCGVHPRESCTGHTERWIPPGGGHDIVQLECTRRTTKSGIVNPNTTLWSPFDVDAQGRPILCPESRSGVLGANPDIGEAFDFCMRHYELAAIGHASGYDLEAAIQEYEKEQGRALPSLVKDNMRWLEQVFARSGPILVSTSEFSPKTASLFDDSAHAEIICGALTDAGFTVAQGVVRQTLGRVPYVGVFVVLVGPSAGSGGAEVAKSVNCSDDKESTSTADGSTVPEVSVSGGDAVTEGGKAIFTVSASPAPSAPLTVDVSVTSSGDFGVAAVSHQVVISTEGTGSLTITTSDDDANEADGSVTATVGDGTGYTVRQSANSASVPVSDDDDAPPADPVVSITAGSGMTEGGDAVFTLAADPALFAPLTVNVTVTQSGDFGVATGSRQVTIPMSGSVTLTVTTTNDSTDEADGSATATISAGSGYTVSATAGTATVAIADDDDPAPPTSKPSISVGDVSAGEGDGSVSFTVEMSTAAAGSVTVYYSVPGATATAYGDYLPEWGQVTFASGDTSKTVRISLIDDDVGGEGSETFLLRLLLVDTTYATLGDGIAEATITDND